MSSSDSEYSNEDDNSDDSSSEEEDNVVRTEEQDDLASYEEEEGEVYSVEEEQNIEEEKSAQEMETTDYLCEMISENIGLLKDDKIGDFPLSNKPFRKGIILRMKEIRISSEGNFIAIQEAMIDLVKEETFLNAYGSLRQIYEFIIHIFDIYDIPIDDTVEANDDKMLCSTLKKAICKKTKYHQHIRDAILTPVQCTTAL